MRFLCAAALAVCCAFSQSNPAWTRPFPAHRIAGNVYYVGTEDLACFLITTPQGHVLINTGLADSTALIRAGVQKVGFKLEDVKILLNMQAHFDHVAAMAEIQRLSGAKVYATDGDAPALEDGGKSDPWFGEGARFEPVRVDRRLKDGDTVALGGIELKVVSTPGHSRGSVSYTMSVDDGGRTRSLAFVNMPTVVMPLRGNPKYPDIAADLERTIRRLKDLQPEIWVAAHGSQYRLQEKFKRGSFVDPEGYGRTVEEYDRSFRKALAEADSRTGSRPAK
jgi:metallo-beta-lactamase class B